MTRVRQSQPAHATVSDKPLVAAKPFVPTPAELEAYQARQRLALQHHTWTAGVQKTVANAQHAQKVTGLETVSQVQRLRGAYVESRASQLVSESRANYDADNAASSRVETPVSQALGGLSDQYTQNLSVLRSKHSRLENGEWHDPKHPVMDAVRNNSNALGAAYLRLRVSHQAKPGDLVAAITRLERGNDRDRLLTGALARFGQHDREAGIVQRLVLEHETQERQLETQKQASTLSLETAQRLAAQEIETPSLETNQRIQQQLGSGHVLPARVQRMLEVALNTPKGTFANWGIHTGGEAKNLTQKLSAHAFNTGKDAFFGKPLEFTNATDFALLAHEATHHLQVLQGRVTGTGVDPDANLETEALTVQARVLTDFSNIEATATRTPTETWKDQAIATTTERFALRGTNPAWQTLNQTIWNQPSSTLPHGATQGTQGKRSDTHNHANPNPHAQDALQYTSTGTGTYSVQRSSLAIQRFSIKEKISDLLGNIPGYDTLCATLGKDLVTGKAVQQNPHAILEKLSSIVPGPLRDMIQHLISSNALSKAWSWFKTELGKINIGAAWQGIKDGLDSFSVWKMNIGEVKNKVVAAVQKPIGQLKTLVIGCGKHIANIILECIGAGFGPAAQRLIASLRGAGDVVTQVIKNPGAFIRNLVQSVKGGLNNFTTNAKTHLAKGLGTWLTGESGLTFPTNLDLKGVFTLTLSVLGITYANFRKQLVTKLGEDKTKIAESKLEIVQSLASKGMMLAEGMDTHNNTVKTEVIEGAKDMVKQSVIQSAITKLVSMFIPGGGLVQLFITGFDMVKFFMTEGSRIMGLINNVLGSVGAIAVGNIGGAVAKVEQSLAASIPLALSFLSKIFKVSGIGTRIKSIMQKVKTKIDAVVAKLMGKVVALAEKATGGVRQGANTAKKAITGVFGKKSFTAGKEQHSIWVKVTNNQPELWIASTPREATAQIDALEVEATTKNIQHLVAPSINVARRTIDTAKLGLQKKIKEGTATGNADENAMTRYATEAVNGIEYSVKNVFDQMEKGASESDLKLNLDFNNLKHEFWSGGRPAFSSATKAALGTLSESEDRRHIQAFDDIFKNAVAAITGKTFKDAGAWLAAKGHKPVKLELQALKNALKSFLGEEFNRLENLWVGEKQENQQKGSDFGATDKELKSLKPGTPEYEAALAKRSAAAVDPAKGTATGKKISTREQAWIDQIHRADRKLSHYVTLFNSDKLKPGNLDYKDATDDRDTVEINQKRLGDFSNQMNTTEFTSVNSALKDATRIMFEFNRILRS